MEWFSWVIAIGVGLSAVISPIATSIINNCHQTKIKKLELFNESRKTSLNDFIEATEECIRTHDNEEKFLYFQSVDKLFIYFPDISLDLFKPLNTALIEFDDYTANNELTSIVVRLSKQITKE